MSPAERGGLAARQRAQWRFSRQRLGVEFIRRLIDYGPASGHRRHLYTATDRLTAVFARRGSLVKFQPLPPYFSMS